LPPNGLIEGGALAVDISISQSEFGNLAHALNVSRVNLSHIFFPNAAFNSISNYFLRLIESKALMTGKNPF
jgi:hypothetical protein